jgi:hypothetical protein
MPGKVYYLIIQKKYNMNENQKVTISKDLAKNRTFIICSEYQDSKRIGIMNYLIDYAGLVSLNTEVKGSKIYICLIISESQKNHSPTQLGALAKLLRGLEIDYSKNFYRFDHFQNIPFPGSPLFEFERFFAGYKVFDNNVLKQNALSHTDEIKEMIETLQNTERMDYKIENTHCNDGRKIVVRTEPFIKLKESDYIIDVAGKIAKGSLGKKGQIHVCLINHGNIGATQLNALIALIKDSGINFYRNLVRYDNIYSNVKNNPAFDLGHFKLTRLMLK